MNDNWTTAQIAALNQEKDDDDDQLRRLYLAGPAYILFLSCWAIVAIEQSKSQIETSRDTRDTAASYAYKLDAITRLFPSPGILPL